MSALAYAKAGEVGTCPGCEKGNRRKIVPLSRNDWNKREGGREMGKSSFYLENDGLGLAHLIKTKQVKKEEVIEEAIKRIEALNPELNAVIRTRFEEGRSAAGSLQTEGPFAGVPMLLKDIAQELKGEPATSGSKSLQQYRAAQDSAFVSKLKKAGAIFLGQTNVPEFALMGITEPSQYGPTRNPWSTAHTPGGSSGGSAAAVASGMVPIAGANDGGGSIRIPAAYCGLFGLKPTRGRTPAGPRFGRHWQGASVDHVLTRTVRDSAGMLDAVKGAAKTDAYHAPFFDDSYLQCAQSPLDKRLKVAFSVRSPLGTDVAPESRQAVFKTAALLEKMGHDVVELEAPADGKKIASSYLTLYFAEVAALLRSLEADLGRKVSRADVEPVTWLLGLIGKATSAEDFVLSMREWDIAAVQMETFHESYDLYMTPATAYPPARIGELEPSSVEMALVKGAGMLSAGKLLKKTGIVEEIAEKNLMRTPFTQLANLTGQPAMSVPLHLTESGLPSGVQFMAARGREDLLLQLAGELEKTPNWVSATEKLLEKHEDRQLNTVRV